MSCRPSRCGWLWRPHHDGSFRCRFLLFLFLCYIRNDYKNCRIKRRILRTKESERNKLTMWNPRQLRSVPTMCPLFDTFPLWYLEIVFYSANHSFLKQFSSRRLPCCFILRPPLYDRAGTPICWTHAHFNEWTSSHSATSLTALLAHGSEKTGGSRY